MSGQVTTIDVTVQVKPAGLGAVSSVVRTCPVTVVVDEASRSDVVATMNAVADQVRVAGGEVAGMLGQAVAAAVVDVRGPSQEQVRAAGRGAGLPADLTGRIRGLYGLPALTGLDLDLLPAGSVVETLSRYTGGQGPRRWEQFGVFRLPCVTGASVEVSAWRRAPITRWVTTLTSTSLAVRGVRLVHVPGVPAPATVPGSGAQTDKNMGGVRRPRRAEELS